MSLHLLNGRHSRSYQWPLGYLHQPDPCHVSAYELRLLQLELRCCYCGCGSSFRITLVDAMAIVGSKSPLQPFIKALKFVSDRAKS